MRGIVEQISRSDGGLPKYAVAGPVMLDAAGVEGDRQRNRRYHGGPDKAVLMVSAEVIDSLAARGFRLVYGGLGENVTVSGLDAHLWRSGQRYRLGDNAVIELTTLRTPCSNLDIHGAEIKAELYDRRCKDGDVSSPVWGYGGIYARVIRGGLIWPGAEIVLESDAA